MSTVRSKVLALDNQLHLGSLSNPKKINVAITRAKSHLVVIGNTEVLKRDKNWYYVLKTCKLNKCWYGRDEFIDNDETQFYKINESQKMMNSSSLLSYVKENSVKNLADSLNSLSLGKMREQLYNKFKVYSKCNNLI